MKFFLSFLIALSAFSCRAQAIPEFAKVGDISNVASSLEYVDWYNKTVVNPKYDTVTVFKMPEFSDLRYVIVYTKCIARVEFNSGRFIGWLDPDHQWIEVVKFDEDGKVVQGMKPIMISAIKEKGLIVQYERCPECKFNPGYKGKL